MKTNSAIARAVLALVAAVAASACGDLSQGTSGSGRPAQDNPDAATGGGSLMVLYAGDIQGVLDPCG